jgi:hypothetical protein
MVGDVHFFHEVHLMLLTEKMNVPQGKIILFLLKRKNVLPYCEK